MLADSRKFYEVLWSFNKHLREYISTIKFHTPNTRNFKLNYTRLPHRKDFIIHNMHQKEYIAW